MMMKEEESKPATQIISSIKSEEEEDRISSLPDCLLVDILSRLPYTDYAIRTGTLSKRWQHLWTQVDNLIISRHSKYNVPQFYSSVERIISQCGQSNLNKFKLFASYTNQTESQVNDCIRNAISHNVQEVDFDMTLDLDMTLYPGDYDDKWFVLPKFFFICSSFIHLKLSRCIFKKAYVVSWENLKSLSIKHGSLDEDLIEHILSGSPLLETLELTFCCGFKRIDIINKSVKNLVFSGYHAPYIYSVEINAPYLLSLTIQDYLPLEKLLLLNVSSLTKAELDYDKLFRNEEMLEGLLLSLGHVKEVKIGESCLKALAGLKAKGFTFPSNLKVLGKIDSKLKRRLERTIT